MLVDLHIGRARFERALSFPDLGLDQTDEDLSDYIQTLNPGKQLLVGASYRNLIRRLDNLEKQARRAVQRHSVKTLFGYAVPCIQRGGTNPFEALVDEIDSLEREYRATYDALMTQLDEIRRDTRSLLESASYRIYKILKKDEFATPPREFIEGFVKRAMANFPSSDHVRAMYQFTLAPKFVPLMQTEREFDSVKHNALQLKSEIIESIRQSYKEQSQNFVEDILANLRQIVYESVTLSLEALRKTGSLPGPTVAGLKKMVQQVQQLNIPNDQVVLSQVQQLETTLNKTARRDPDEIRKLLEELQNENRRFLLALGYQPRSTRTLPETEGDPFKKLPRLERQARSIPTATEEPNLPPLRRQSR